MNLYVWFGLMLMLSMLWVVWFLYRPLKINTLNLEKSNIALGRQKQKELEQDLQGNLIDEQVFEQAKDEIAQTLSVEITHTNSVVNTSQQNVSITLVVLIVALLFGASVLVYQSLSSHNIVTTQAPTLEESIVIIKQRVAEKPDDAKAWRMLGLASLEAGDIQAFLTAYEQAYQLDAKNVTLLVEYASMLAITQDTQFTERMSSLVREALEIDPNEPNALHLAGWIAVDAQQFDLAQKLWQKTLSVLPEGSTESVELQRRLAELSQILTKTPNTVKVVNKVTATVMPDELGFINHPDNKSSITKVLPIESTVIFADKGDLKEFIKQYVAQPRPVITAYGDYSQKHLIFPQREVTKVNYVHLDDASNIFGVNTILSFPHAEWQMWFEMLSYHRCHPDNAPSTCKNTERVYNWLDRTVKLIALDERPSSASAVSPNNGFNAIVITTPWTKKCPLPPNPYCGKPHRQTRYTTYYLGVNGKYNKRTAASALEVDPPIRLYAEYEYRINLEDICISEGGTWDTINNTCIGTNIVKADLCTLVAGVWGDTNNVCTGTEITQVELEDMAAFYTDNDIKPTTEIKNVITEYINTETSTTHPIPIPLRKVAVVDALEQHHVRVEVILSEHLRKAQYHNHYLMVYVKAAQGRSMPIAIQKIKLKDFKGVVLLTDENSVIPTQKLSQSGKILAVVRLSQSGLAMRQADDIEVVSQVIDIADNPSLKLKL